ncbi:MAG TPA: hypothetical protein VIP98_07510 [Microlunatus sp.]
MTETAAVAVPGARRCRARNRAGDQCGRYAIPGGVVCDRHGGRAPQVQRAARLRLAELVEPAIAVLARLLANPDVAPAVRLRAAVEILDRTGYQVRATPLLDGQDARAVVKEQILQLLAARRVDAGDDLGGVDLIEPTDDIDDDEQENQ